MLAKLSPTTLGILLALSSYAVYTWSDALVKGVGGSVGIFEIGFFTTLFALLPALVAKPQGERWRDSFRLRRPWLVNLIAICRVGSAIFITYSFITIPFAEAYSIVFLIPVFITLLAVLILREQVGPERWVLVIVSFLGVMLVVRPGFRELELGHLTALLCALCAATATTAMRLIASEERRVSLFLIPGLYTLAVNAVLMLPSFRMPDWPSMGMLLVCGALGGVGYLLQINAIRFAPASRVAPMQYSQIVWALAIGALFFAEIPDAIAMLGLAVVIIAGIAAILADGARARIAGRFTEFRARKPGRPIDPSTMGPPDV